ncbi:hypothetical protein LC048_15190 [Mesobacillus subterraneus]|uniref:hypothetical protein n=1 Tax=Mesobacillus subterraneus TaxID=285983 RepID=UPI00273DBBE5|nr:hypothetical protein [Mesobacillus subterraneus]WLR53850.1 hypothetical protein LC048_15190 [Mesobacillus subterraneus]
MKRVPIKKKKSILISINLCSGGRPRNNEEASEQNGKSDSPLNQYLGKIDLDEVMHHVDTLITSARELKPLMGKVKPLFDHFIEKK